MEWENRTLLPRPPSAARLRSLASSGQGTKFLSAADLDQFTQHWTFYAADYCGPGPSTVRCYPVAEAPSQVYPSLTTLGLVPTPE